MTVIYYTCNKEIPTLVENATRELLYAIGDKQLISVSHKPIDLGMNICVGDVGTSAYNVWRQMQIGVLEAKTEFVCNAEADCLYPKEYFQFVPPRKDVLYFARPLHVVFAMKGKARVYARKNPSECAMVGSRDLFLRIFDKIFDGRPQWDSETKNIETEIHDLVKTRKFELPVSVITFKTDNNIHRKTPFARNSITRELPYWGNASSLVYNFCGDI